MAPRVTDQLTLCGLPNALRNYYASVQPITTPPRHKLITRTAHPVPPLRLSLQAERYSCWAAKSCSPTSERPPAGPLVAKVSLQSPCCSVKLSPSSSIMVESGTVIVTVLGSLLSWPSLTISCATFVPALWENYPSGRHGLGICLSTAISEA